MCQEDAIPGGPPNAATLVRVFGYDAYGRPAITTTMIGSDSYADSTTYDQHGRVSPRFDGGETYSRLEVQYTPNGHVEAAIESAAAPRSVERYRITAPNARGRVTGMSKGGLDVSRTYSADSGRLQSIYAQTQLAVTIQDPAFDWDVLGNLSDKVDSHRGLTVSARPRQRRNSEGRAGCRSSIHRPLPRWRSSQRCRRLPWSASGRFQSRGALFL